MDNSSAADIHACVDAVLHGGIWVPPCIAQAVVSSRRCRLTRREAQLVSLVSQGMSNKDIAFSLGISVGTVKVYLSRLFDKLEVSDRYELALVGLRQAGSAHAGAFRDAAQGTAGIGSQSVFVPRSNERWHHEASVS
jgi:DNA-binding NarL/FixJ family response regulator